MHIKETPAEKRLRELGIRERYGAYGIGLFDRYGAYGIGLFDRCEIDVAVWSPDQLEAIAAHMREQEGGAK